MATLAELKTAVIAKIGLDATADDVQLQAWLNQGYEDILVRTRTKVQSLTVTPGAAENYTMSTSVLAVLDMFFTANSESVPLERVPVEDLLRMRRVTGATGPARYYALAGHDLVMFFPTPSATDVLTMYCVKRPTALTASAMSPSDLPSEYHKSIEWYALWQAADYDDDSSSGMGTGYQAQYEKSLMDIRKAARGKGGRSLQARVGRRSRLVADPSRDMGY